MQLIGFYGKSGTGKNSVAKVLIRLLKERGMFFGSWAFGHPVKAEVYAKRQLPQYDMLDIIERKPLEVRDRLQKYGTQEGRYTHGMDLWLYHAKAYLYFLESGFDFIDGVVFTDIRFENEAEFVQWGGRILDEEWTRLSYEVSSNLKFDVSTADEYLDTGEIKLLLKMDNLYHNEMTRRIEEEKSLYRGYVLSIETDRDTLDGQVAAHESENQKLKDQYIDGVIINNKTTTEEELKEQLYPWVEKLILDKQRNDQENNYREKA